MIGRIKIGYLKKNHFPVCVKDRFLPTILIGSTGTGKSCLIENIFWQDFLFSVLSIVVDPSGFLARNCYALAKRRVDYCSLAYPFSLNPMLLPYTHNQVADIIIETINHLVLRITGKMPLTPKMIAILREAIVWCLERGRTSLDLVKAYIENLKGNNETRDGILSRLNLILGDKDYAKIICGNRYLDVGKLKRSFILDCSKMGEYKMIFLGTLVTNTVKAFFNYGGVASKGITLLVDECHNFIDKNFLRVIKEARKYGISTLLSTTDFSGLDSNLIHALLSNAGNIICLRAGYVEAAMIAREFREITSSDIQGLEKYYAVFRTPEEEGIIELPHPIYVKPLEPPIMEVKQSTLKLKWFPLKSYPSDTTMTVPPGVVSDDQRQGSETVLPSTEGG